MKNKGTYVWSFLGRLSHWLIVVSFFACYYTSFYEQMLNLHVALGIFVLGMLFKKIVWGIIGPRYARWSDYHFSLDELKFYFIEKIENRYREIKAGHNPASSWFSFIVTWLGIVCCIEGLVLYGIQEGNGVFAFLNKSYYSYMEIFDYLHIIFVYILLVMIFFHISGVLIEQFYHKTNMMMAMISGYKRAKGQDIKPRFYMVFWGSFYTGLVFIIAVYSYISVDNIFVVNNFKPVNYKEIHEDFYYECSDCHNLIPPYLLPKESWIKLIKDQHKHFDEDLELDENLVNSIEEFLVNNSSETSSRESSYKLTKELKNTKKYVISKTKYWKRIHKDIPNKIFNSKKIETKSNCVACHKNFENGVLSDINITYLSKKHNL